MRYVIGLLVILVIVLYSGNVKQCNTDSNCAIIWDMTDGLPY